MVEGLKGLGVENAMMDEGIEELDIVMGLLENDGRAEQIRADMKIVRGLDYYTGTVFEFNLPEYPGVGSVCGGGRYENLAEYFTEQKLPGVGGSIGLTRLFYVLNANGLVKDATIQPVDYAIVPISANEMSFALKVAAELRAAGSSVTIVGTDKKLGDKLKYAAQVAKKGIVLGESEAQTGKYEIKEFK